MTDRVIVFLTDGRPLALGEAEFRAALQAGEAFAAPASSPVAGQSAPERLLDSRELAAMLGVGDTTLEGMASRGEIPSVRIGKALRFEPLEVLAALKAGHADSPTATPSKPSARSGSCSPPNHRATVGTVSGKGVRS